MRARLLGEHWSIAALRSASPAQALGKAYAGPLDEVVREHGKNEHQRTEKEPSDAGVVDRRRREELLPEIQAVGNSAEEL